MLKVSQLQAVVTKYDEFGESQMCLCYSRREVYVLETACGLAVKTTSENVLKLTHGNIGFPKNLRGSYPRSRGGNGIGGRGGERVSPPRKCDFLPLD